MMEKMYPELIVAWFILFVAIGIWIATFLIYFKLKD